MSIATARRDIELRMEANWATTRIAMANMPFTKPASGESWVKIRVFEDRATRTNIGRDAVHRYSGTIAVEIYVPQKTGTGTIRGYADTIAEIFRDQQFNGITCEEARVVPVGDFEGWYQMNVTVPFYWDGRYYV